MKNASLALVADESPESELPVAAARLARGEDGATYWWVEATRGSSTSYLTVAELDGKSYTSEEMRQVAQSALGDVDLLATSNAS